MRLPPIRPPAKLPRLWQQHPELAPPRRLANAAFLRGNLLAGLFTRFPAHPTCGARTKRGTRARHQRSLVPPAAVITAADACCCVAPGQTLSKSRSPSVLAKCLWYLDKAHRNRIRRHLKVGERPLALREEEAQRSIALRLQGDARRLGNGGLGRTPLSCWGQGPALSPPGRCLCSRSLPKLDVQR